MSRFVRQSKYRHVFGTAAKKDKSYDGLKPSTSAWDTNLLKVNPSYLALNWGVGGGGAFAVIPLELTGKLPDGIPLYRGHTAQVLDTDFSPFNHTLISSCAEDSQIMLWKVQDKIIVGEDEQELPDFGPMRTLSGHGRKVGHVLFHPAAENVLASTSGDHTVRLWDVEHGAEQIKLDGFQDAIQSITWDYNGNLLTTTCRDKKLRIFDARSREIVQSGPGHDGLKASRAVWMGNTKRFITTGASKTSERQIKLWDASNLSSPVKTVTIDTSAGILMPFFDADTNILYVAGKGDGNIRYYEIIGNDIHYLSEYKSSDPQRGMAMMPKIGVNYSECEVTRLYKLHGSGYVEPLSFVVPRKSEAFQADIFPATPGDSPALSAEEWFQGKTADPKLINLDDRTFVNNAGKILLEDTKKKVEDKSSLLDSKPPKTMIPPENKAVVINDPIPNKTEAVREAPDTRTEMKEKVYVETSKAQEQPKYADLPPTKTNGNASPTSLTSSTISGEEIKTSIMIEKVENLQMDFDAIRKEVDNLRKQVEEKDVIIAELQRKVHDLESGPTL